MSFLLMNLFAAPAQAAPLAGNAAAKDSASAAQGGTGNGAAFSAMLAGAKERLATAKAAGSTPLNAQPIDAATMQAIKQPADILAGLKDMALTDQQLSDLRAALRDVLDSENFAGNEQTEQAFQELHDQLDTELGDAGGQTDVVDMDAVVLQLPTVNAAAQQPRGELIARIAQFIQSTLSGQGNAGAAKPEQPAQIVQHASNRTDPLLEVVQASMFPVEAVIPAQTQGASDQQTHAAVASAAEPNAVVVPAAMTVVENDTADDLPQWVRDIAPAAKPSAKKDDGDIYRGAPLPEVNLPGEDGDAAAMSDEAPADSVVSKPQNQVAAAQQQTTTQQAPAVAVMAQTPEMHTQPVHTASVASQAVAQVPVQAPQATARQVPLTTADSDKAEDSASTAANATNAAPATTNKSAKFVAALEAATAKPQTHAPREQQLNALPEAKGNDVTLEAARIDVAPQTNAPTHNDKLVATQAQRATDASLYQHRAQVVEQVHVAIARASKADMDRITIQLDPADLGRVDVTMDVRRDGVTQLVVTADRRETLDMLQRDARGLERALQDAGVKADAGSMEFNLRQQHGQSAMFGGQQGFNQNPNHAQHAALHSETASANGTTQTVIEPEIISSATYTVNGGLNVIV